MIKMFFTRVELGNCRHNSTRPKKSPERLQAFTGLPQEDPLHDRIENELLQGLVVKWNL
jgi:hypothetical protein